MKLASLQELFWQSVRAQRAPDAVRDQFVSRDALGAVRRMQIYRSAYWRRHEICLQESYPRLLSVLGEARFRGLVAAYIEAHPSTDPAIEWAGRALPAFVKSLPRDSKLAQPEGPELLAGLAAVEWARLQVRLQRDATDFDPASLADPNVADARLHLSPALCVVKVPQAAWLLAQDSAGDDQVANEQDPQFVVVWRARGGVREMPVNAEQGRALTRASRRETLAEVCSEFAEPEATEHARQAMTQWIGRGWIERLEKSQ